MNDHDRPLAPRGVKAAEMMHDHLVAAGIQPELVLCSSSRRTRETLAGVAPSGEVLVEPALYDASVGTILARLHELPDTTSSVMVIGHQPEMQALTLQLDGSARHADDDSPRAEVERKFPTGALATIEFDGPWRELAPGTATLTAFVRPKALRNGAVR